MLAFSAEMLYAGLRQKAVIARQALERVDLFNIFICDTDFRTGDIKGNSSKLINDLNERQEIGGDIFIHLDFKAFSESFQEGARGPPSA